ncbi:MAG: ABC transporter permease [Clostridiales bacterium]|nr:ABC transporter permease [Clostridiales bacterium]
MHNTKSRLSPWPYLRNNRVRSTALVISLAMFMVMIYVMNYIIGGTNEPFRKCDVETMDRLRIVSSRMNLDNMDFDSDEAFLAEAWKEAADLGKEMEKEEDVVRAVPYAAQYVSLNSFIGQYGVDCYLFQEASCCEMYLSHMEAKLISGRMPENPGEIVVDRKLLDNHKNDNDLLKSMGTSYKVVGEVSSEYYLCFGIAMPGENNVVILAMVKPGSDIDLRPVVEKQGYKVRNYVDTAVAEKNLVEGMGGSLDTVQTIFTGVSGGLLLICVSVVVAIHIMDRHNEWCLLNSIGFSTSEIYLMALKELLICVLLAMIVGTVLSFGSCILMEKLMYNPIGITINIYRIGAIPRILAVIALLLGIAQIPLFSGMRKIQTIDAIE